MGAGEVGESRNSAGLRTAVVARLAGYSVQQVRNLERDGVLPPARRTPTGYRVYDDTHVRAARSYRALAAGVGPVEAKTIMRAVHEGPPSQPLALLDAAHARLDRERRDLALAQAAVHAIADESIDDVRATDAMSISELAEALGVRPSTLRHWEAMGLVTPGRSSTGAARSYRPGDVRDARIVHQLRLAGYRIAPLQSLMPQLRGARRWAEVLAGLSARDADITARSRALLTAAAELDALLPPIGAVPDAR
ncbi:MerR family transcriptional regulator [Nocardia otitidiscaviarum]|uniref:MerR family transcriptional regulator n=1 Tax=Nocardia otitidiscaviarum TaxID=1823 RepID=UPI001895BE9D|nr:MerR family transcriptional regulator [Nocardia otitidiscaviarum]MBF6240767.1 MerR family transcriptional regulator [Nocardia otitidiscaviarum]